MKADWRLLLLPLLSVSFAAACRATRTFPDDRRPIQQKTLTSTPATDSIAVNPVEAASPVPQDNSIDDELFSIQNGKLIDPSGQAFVLRGINMPFAYYFDKSFLAIDQAKATGFNSVRVVWCADNYQDSQKRCQPKDFRSAEDLDRVLTKITDARMVTVFNLQNATGQNSVDALMLMVDYVLRADIKAVLMKHKKNILINIANEWLGSWDKNRSWVDGYLQAIDRLREAALPHVLIVDARGYGQDFSSLEENASELMAHDQRLLFSSHMYAVYGTDKIVQDRLNFIRSRQIPFMIGEFGCTHYDDGSAQNKPVACDAILRETASSAYPIGTMAWSYAGNRREEVDLDVFHAADWKTLSAFGERIVQGPYGVKATAKQACYFDRSKCP